MEGTKCKSPLQLPQSHWKQVPISVSVVENECDLATNNLRVTYNRLKGGNATML